MRAFSSSEPFALKSASAIYRRALEEVMQKFPDETDFVGVVDIPKHVISFQFGPKGYALYDSFNKSKGFFEFPTSAVFFTHLSAHTLWDVECSKYSELKKRAPDTEESAIREATRLSLESVKITFKIHPLTGNQVFQSLAPIGSDPELLK